MLESPPEFATLPMQSVRTFSLRYKNTIQLIVSSPGTVEITLHCMFLIGPNDSLQVLASTAGSEQVASRPVLTAPACGRRCHYAWIHVNFTTFLTVHFMSD